MKKSFQSAQGGYMKGIELSERFYLEYGAPMLEEKFPHLLGKIAVGLAGGGSECFGYDDGISTDHDFEPGFCIFLPDEDVVDRRSAFELERAYAKLPKEFMGFKRSPLDPVGGNRHGVIRMSDFFRDKTGSADGELSLNDWFFLPEQSLSEAVNGKAFFDGLGKFTEIREKLACMPSDVRLKKLAGELLVMGQAGQYNYPRCIARGENAAAQLALFEFVNGALHVAFLLNKRYMPYYKWSFRALRELQSLSSIYEDLEHLISNGNSDTEASKKQEIVERVCTAIVNELRLQGLTNFSGSEMEGHAYSVNDHVSNGDIRNKHILYAV